MLSQNPDLDGIWAVWDVPAEGVHGRGPGRRPRRPKIATEDLGKNVAIALAKDETGRRARRPACPTTRASPRPVWPPGAVLGEETAGLCRAERAAGARTTTCSRPGSRSTTRTRPPTCRLLRRRELTDAHVETRRAMPASATDRRTHRRRPRCEMRGIHKSFDGVVVLTDVDFEVAQVRSTPSPAATEPASRR